MLNPLNTQLPHSIEAEQALLGSILIDPRSISRIRRILTTCLDFYIVRNQWVYDAMLKLADEQQPIDLVTLGGELQERGKLAELGGAAYLSNLIGGVPTALNSEAYARIVKEKAQDRFLLDIASEAARLAYANGAISMDDKISRIASLLSRLRSGSGSEVSLRDAVKQVWDKVDEWADSPVTYGQVRGIPTGLIDLDAMLGGLERGSFYILAGRPGMGKSALAYQIGLYAAQVDNKVLVYSLEMTSFQVAARLACGSAGVEWRRVKDGQLTSEEYGRLIKAMEPLLELPMIIDDSTSTTTATIAARAAELKPDLIIVDHFHLLKDNQSDNPVQALGRMAMGLKDIAKDAKCPVLSVVQLSRGVESRQDKRPLMSDLRESGRIEEAADVVAMIYREDYYDPQSANRNIAEIVIRKFRDGNGDASAELFFDRKYALFRDASRKDLSKK